MDGSCPQPLPLLMDGAAVSELRKRGMDGSVCPSVWMLEHPQVLLDLQRSYVAAGSGVLVTPTFTANAGMLAAYGLADRVEEFNLRLTELTRASAGGRCLVAGDLGPTGHAIPPYGNTPFEALVDLYAQQAAALARGGVDLFLVESVSSMAEARSAVLAARRAAPELPIWVTCTCDSEGRTATGTDVLAAAIVMQGMGVSAFGLNGVSAAVAEEQLSRLHMYTDLPLIAEPGGDDDAASPAEFARRTPRMAAHGVRIFGGCGGTSSQHIAALRAAMDAIDFAALPALTLDSDVIPCASEKEARFITPDVDVGDAIECGPDLMEDILEAEEGRPQGALKIAILEEDDVDIFAENQYVVKDALCLWSDVPELLEAALRVYQGRAFWDGTGDLEPEVLRRLSREYGLILL